MVNSNTNKHKNTVTGLGYSGQVTIKYADTNNKECKYNIKNSGTADLFTAIMKLLAGMDASSDVPIKLQGFTDELSQDSTAFIQPIIYATTPIIYTTASTGSSEAQGEGAFIEYSFVIPINMIKNRGATIKQLALLNKKDKICASIKLSPDQFIATNISSNILIYWKMHITNA